MDWLRVIVPILGVVGLACLLWWMEKNKVKSPVAWGAIGIGLVLLLLWLKGWIGDTLLLLLLGLRMLEQLPSWVFYAVVAVAVGLIFRFILIAIANSFTELEREIEKTNARIELLENSIRHKLGDISSRFPEK